MGGEGDKYKGEAKGKDAAHAKPVLSVPPIYMEDTHLCVLIAAIPLSLESKSNCPGVKTF